MSRNNSTENFGGIDSIVNGLAIIVTITLVGAGYVTAVGSFVGLA